MTRAVYAIEIVAYDDDLAATRTLTYCSGEGFNTRSGDTPANTHFSPRVIDPGSFSQFIIAPLVTDGKSRVGTGAVVLTNPDGALDGLKEYGLDGRAITIRRGVPGEAYPAEWETMLIGTMEQIEFTLETITILIRSRQAEVADLPYQSVTYAGDNVPPNGVEGTADDLLGRPKPVLLGNCFNESPPLVNYSKQTFQVSTREINDGLQVYVGGEAITAGTEHASLAALQAASPSGGTFDYYLGSGSDGAYFRLGSSPDHPVTCSAQSASASSTDRSAAKLAKQALLDVAVASGDIDSSSVTALDALNDKEVGLWTGLENWRAGDVLDALLGSIGGYWTISATGQFAFGRLDAPSGSPARTIRRYEILSLERLRGRGDDKGLPAWRTRLNYRPNGTAMKGADVVPAADAQYAATIAREVLTITVEDAAVKTKHLLSPEKEITTRLFGNSAASDEADRLATMYKAERDFLRISMATTHFLAGGRLALGDVVSLLIDRYGMDSGKLMRVTGIIHEFSRDITSLELWG